MNSSSIITRRFGAALAVAALAAGTTGCYFMQAATGQTRVMLARVPMNRVIADPQTPAALRRRLQQVIQIRDFASRELDLPDNGSYRSYADVHRPYVVWNVFAAPEFSVQAKQWCYPIVGCVAYRGYFVESAARRYADGLRAQGFDVAVDGVAAYSTLGHFDDPILNTMLGWSDIELASIVFHELTHQLLYVPNDSSFDEAFATVVEQEGVRRWLRSAGRDADLAAYSVRQSRYQRVVDLLIAARTDLAALYAAHLGPNAMRAAKRAKFAALKTDYAKLKAEWSGRAPFDDWFAAELNNANLVSISTYASCVPGFERELAAAGADLARFYARVRALARLDDKARDAAVCGPAASGNRTPSTQLVEANAQMH